MTITGTFYNVKCDCCGCMADEEMWHNEENTVRGEVMANESWKTLGGKDYCPNCWHYDDDNWLGEVIITKDGRKFDVDTEEEL